MRKKNLYLFHNDIDDMTFSIKTDNKLNKQNFCIDIYNILKKYKNFIDNININSWDFYKKKTYDYEYIEKKKKIVSYTPISRAWFKLHEIIVDHNLFLDKENLTIVGLAEGPGGFMQCINDFRKKNKDFYVCMSLVSSHDSIPNWNKYYDFKKNNINIFNGHDNTGNIYTLENIIALKNYLTNKADYVTCDGGFNYSVNYNNQEQLSYRLILCQIICTLNILKKKGHMIIKIYDIFTEFTLKILYFLTTLFEETNVVKPHTSRMANSEKYIICKKFYGIDEIKLENLNKIVKEWEEYENNNLYIYDIFNFDTPSEFNELIYSYNYNISYNQVKTILKTIVYMNIKIDSKYINNRLIYYAIEWCKKYKVNYKKLVYS